MKPYPPKLCAWCGEWFEVTGTRSLYCSVSHREKARWRRFTKTATAEQYARRLASSNQGREHRNAYHREYQREWRKHRTPEQIARHREQQRAWYERKKAAA